MEFYYELSLVNTIVAFGEAGEGVWCDSCLYTTLECSDIYGNAGGDYVGALVEQNGINGNFSADPLFCDPENGDLTLDGASPCLWAPGCGQVGAYWLGCGSPPTEVVGAEDHACPIPVLAPVRPNPFNATTTLRFSVPTACPVALTIHDITGRLIAIMAQGLYQPGEFTEVWDGKDDGGADAPSGIYFARLRAGEYGAVRKMVLIH